MNKETTKLKKPMAQNSSVICCGVLEKMLIAWMVMEDGTKVMPFIPGDDGNKYRVNNCPSCGTYVRDVQVKP
jgi:hypothetical protein